MDRTSRVVVLLTSDEKEQVETAARTSGMSSSSWLRQIALERVGVPPQAPAADQINFTVLTVDLVDVETIVGQEKFNLMRRPKVVSYMAELPRQRWRDLAHMVGDGAVERLRKYLHDEAVDRLRHDGPFSYTPEIKHFDDVVKRRLMRDRAAALTAMGMVK